MIANETEHFLFPTVDSKNFELSIDFLMIIYYVVDHMKLTESRIIVSHLYTQTNKMKERVVFGSSVSP